MQAAWVEFVGGPKDGHRAMIDSGAREWLFPLNAVATIFSDEPVDLTARTLRVAVYQGPLHNPDRAHAVFRFAREEMR